jgi:hypothetical protein
MLSAAMPAEMAVVFRDMYIVERRYAQKLRSSAASEPCSSP